MNVAADAKRFETKLPPAVARLAAQADELQNRSINPDPPPGDPPPGDPPPGDPPLGDLPPQDPSQDPPVDPMDDGTWKHKFLSMQGRYTADTGRLKGQLEAMSGQITNLNSLIGNLRSAPPAREETFRPAPVKPLITPEEVGEYGEEFVDFASRLAGQEVSRATQPLMREIEQLKQQVGGVGQHLHQDARERLLSQLDTQLPGWRDVNSNQEYLDWLSLTDPYTGAIRQDILNEAFEQNNFPRVAAFFKGFLAELAATAPPQKGIEPNGGGTPPKLALESIVAPGRAKSAAAITPPGAPPEKPFITTSQITKFYNDVSSGKFKGREAAQAEFEAKIFEAQNEGRIRN